MNQKIGRKLSLTRETVRSLRRNELEAVVGGIEELISKRTDCDTKGHNCVTGGGHCYLPVTATSVV